MSHIHQTNEPEGISPRHRTPAMTARLLPPGTHPIALVINGRHHQLEVSPWTTLLDLLREHLDMTGTKKGCDHGQCGACTVLVDDRRINACLTLAVMRDGARITTIEGIASGEGLHPLQQAFIDFDALQCGYCTPGQICSGVGLIHEGHASNAAEVRELMSGNLCRCGAYPQILQAVCAVALPRTAAGDAHTAVPTAFDIPGTAPS